MDDGAARKIERKAQAECEPFLDVAHCPLANIGREVVEPAQLVVISKVAPV
jgi:hypothetical protein